MADRNETVKREYERGELAKLFFIGLAGGVVGALPYLVLLCAGNISSIAIMILSGAGVAAFFAGIGRGEIKGAAPYVIMTAGTILSSLIANVLSVLIHYAPKIDIEGRKMNVFQKAFYLYTHSKPDQITSDGFVVSDDAFSIYTVLIAMIVFALIGLFATVLFLKISEKRGKNKSRA